MRYYCENCGTWLINDKCPSCKCDYNDIISMTFKDKHRLCQDAARYQYIRDHLAKSDGPKMDGKCTWGISHPRGKLTGRLYGPTIDIVIDQAIAEYKEWCSK